MNLQTETDFERELRLSHFTIEQSPDAVVWVDVNAYIHRVNQAACRLYGYTSEELLGQKIYALLRGEDEQIWQRRWQSLKKYRTILFSRIQPTKDGRVIPVEVRANFIEFEGQEYACSFLRDVSPWQQMETDLEESQRQLTTLINNLPGAVYRYKPDASLTLELLTPWSERITGYPPEAVIGNARMAWIDIIHPEERVKVLANIQTALADQKPGRLIYRIVTAGGEEKWVSDRFRGVYADNGDILAVEGFFADITQQIQSEKDLAQALLEVEHLKNQLEAENIYLRQEIQLTHNFEEIQSQNRNFKRVLAQVEQVAPTDATVLILGETGTGKELIARAVHNLSGRRERPLVKVNCAALPANLIESELFGHEKGAFTGALTQKIGRFELAHKGTIFLDEIGEMPLDLQVKLLRVLQEGEFERLGNPKTMRVDVRVIAATNRDLTDAIAEGIFREDLFYRLNVFPIHVPPLRDRSDDIPLLVAHFIQKYGQKNRKQITTVPQKAMNTLQAYTWPGNVRELENIIERAVILSRGPRLELGDWFGAQAESPDDETLLPLEDAERQYIRKVLDLTHWRVSGEKGAAAILGINPQTLFSRMKRLGIQRPG